MKNILLAFVIASCLLTTSCSKSEEKENKTNTQTESYTPKVENISYASSQSQTSSKLTLSDDNIYYSKFLTLGKLLFYSDNDNNNKLSIVEDYSLYNYLDSNSSTSVLDYSIESISSIDSNIYFSNVSDGNSLYRFDYVKNQVDKIMDGSFRNIISNAENIFYINNINSSLCSINPNTKEHNMITNDKCGNFVLNGNNILYQNLSDNSSLYSINIDGTNRNKLTSAPVDSFSAYNNCIYYISSIDNKLYKLDLSLKTTTKMGNIKGSNLKIFNQKLYYIDFNTNKLNSISLNNFDKDPSYQTISKDMINDYFINSEGIFIYKPSNINKTHFISFNN